MFTEIIKTVGAILATVLASSHALAASAPSLLWQSSFGGGGGEALYSLRFVSGGGYLAGGRSSSVPGGSKTSPAYGGDDFWVVRVGPTNQVLWDASFGGTGDDVLFSLNPTRDGGWILGGFSTSAVGGNKTSAGYGGRDYWLVRIDSAGNRLWDRAFGGDANETLLAVDETNDGGFICVGASYSGASGSKSDAGYGGGDIWVVRLDASGNKLWDKALGGVEEDIGYSVRQLSDGGFVIGASSASGVGTGKSSPNYGGSDFWVIRLDAGGDRRWDRSLGGTGLEGLSNVAVASATNGDVLVSGDSSSAANGNKTSPNFGLEDFWVVRLSSSGQVLWDRSFGGIGSDYPTSLQATSDGGGILAGGSDSGASGNKIVGNFGSVDFWVVRFDGTGAKLWEQGFGGNSYDGFDNVTVEVTADGGFLLGGDSSSGVSGNKSMPSFGGKDFWVLKLEVSAPPALRIAQVPAGQPGFELFLQGTPGHWYLTEHSSDLIRWTGFSTNHLVGPEIQIIDPEAFGVSRRFYRAREWP